MKAGGRQMLQMMSATETEDSLKASYKKFQALREEVDKERFEMMLSIRKILTDDQRKKDYSYEITCSDRAGRNLYFDSTMPHHKSGLEYFIRHMTVDVRHDPQK
jgi:hypothetical protein